MIDLHMHTTCSDGSDTPAQVLQKAADLKLSVVSITDHNSVGAYDQLPDPLPVKLIRGVEITCMYKGEVVEVLGYHYDLDLMKQQLKEHVLTFEEKQNREFDLLLAAYQKIGLTFDRDQIHFDPTKESCRKAFLKELNRHPENRRFFSSEESWTVSRAFARQEVYNPQSALYVDESPLYPTVAEAAKMIHMSHGIAQLAHLYIYASCMEIRKDLRAFVLDNGLDGVECAHSEFSLEQIHDLESFCEENGFTKSGGSDYHGTRKPNVAQGTGRGQLCIPESYLDTWNIQNL